jgi:lipopolysaccharide/colanic/teichoic acid biosynthesis glycosyltransferase
VAERILILGITALTDEILLEAGRHPRRYRIVGLLDHTSERALQQNSRAEAEALARLETAVRNVPPDRIVVASSERRGQLSMRALLDVTTRYGMHVEEATSFYERLSGKVAIDSLSPSSIVFSWRVRQSRIGALADRLLNAGVALAALIVLSPICALVAAAIRLDSEGPILFVQERIGAGGRPFRLLKFRTMRVASGPTSEWEADNRERVTRVGRWLRRCRVDELPQLVNILRGEMRLVGPRPHPVSNGYLFTLVSRNLNERTGSPIAYYALRSIVPPGVTGWAQVRYRYANNLEEEVEKLRYDLYYIKHRSPWLDLRILVETAMALVFGRGAAASDATRLDDERLDQIEIDRGLERTGTE